MEVLVRKEVNEDVKYSLEPRRLEESSNPKGVVDRVRTRAVQYNIVNTSNKVVLVSFGKSQTKAACWG